MGGAATAERATAAAPPEPARASAEPARQRRAEPRVFAHELGLRVVPPGDPLEHEAEQVGDAVSGGEPARVSLRAAEPMLARTWVVCESGEPDCPARDTGEEARASAAPLAIGTLVAPEPGIIVSSFPISVSDASALPRGAGWSGFVSSIATPGSRWEALGFSDCRGGERLNTSLRQHRAEAVTAALPAAARAQVDRAAGAPLADCVATNDTEANRAFNRSVVLRQTQSEVTVDPEQVRVRTCPPRSRRAAVSLNEYIDLVACAERMTGLAPRPMLALLRQLYYGKPWSVSPTDKWDNVIRCSPNVGDPRTLLDANLYGALIAADEIAGVDIGHVFTGLEAATCPTPEVEFYWGVLTVEMPNVAFATWGGDLGKAVAAFTACPAIGARAATEEDCGRDSRPQTFDYHWNAQASDQDLEGDIDAYVLRAGLLGIPCAGSGEARLTLSRPVSWILRDYYTDPSSALGTTRPNRYRCMAEILGCTISAGRIENRAAVADAMTAPVHSFASIYFRKIYGPPGTPNFGENLVMRNYARVASERFLIWLEHGMSRMSGGGG